MRAHLLRATFWREITILVHFRVMAPPGGKTSISLFGGYEEPAAAPPRKAAPAPAAAEPAPAAAAAAPAAAEPDVPAGQRVQKVSLNFNQNLPTTWYDFNNI